MEVILYSKECNWYTRCCPLNGGVRYRECPLREATLYILCKLPGRDSEDTSPVKQIYFVNSSHRY